MKVGTYIVIVLLLVTNLLVMGCIDINHEYLTIDRNESPNDPQDYLNLTGWDLTPYPTLKKGLEEFLANKSLERKRYPVSHEEAQKIIADISAEHPYVIYKKEHLAVGILIS